MSQQIKQPGFGSYLNVIFLPFMYFFTRKKVVAGIVTLIVCIVSIPLAFVFGLGFFTYGFFASMPAAWALRNESIEAHATRTAQATAEAFERVAQKNSQQVVGK